MWLVRFTFGDHKTHFFALQPNMDVVEQVMKCEGVLCCVPGTLGELLLEWTELAKKKDQVIWPLIPFALCWSIWKLRNDVVFNSKVYCVETAWDMQMVRMIWLLKSWWHYFPYSLEKFVLGIEHMQYTKRSMAARQVVPWCSPTVAFVKFTVDKTSKGNPRVSGIGGVLRNHQGNVLDFVQETRHLWLMRQNFKRFSMLLFFVNNMVYKMF